MTDNGGMTPDWAAWRSSWVACVKNVQPNDLDVVPDMADDNLAHLAAALRELDAFPEPAPDWQHGLTVDAVRRWRPLLRFRAISPSLQARVLRDSTFMHIAMARSR